MRHAAFLRLVITSKRKWMDNETQGVEWRMACQPRLASQSRMEPSFPFGPGRSRSRFSSRQMASVEYVVNCQTKEVACKGAKLTRDVHARETSSPEVGGHKRASGRDDWPQFDAPHSQSPTMPGPFADLHNAGGIALRGAIAHKTAGHSQEGLHHDVAR